MEFVLRSGDLGGGGQFGGRNRALEGTRGHQRLQKQRPAGYEPEVPVRWSIEDPDFVVELKGRIDGVLMGTDFVLIEEIKTTRRRREGPPDPVHWGQAKVYAFIYAREHSHREASVRLTYLELASGESTHFEESFSLEALERFFTPIVEEYVSWLRSQREWAQERDASIRQLPFPFAEYRPGQRQLAVSVYRTLKARERLFAEAPTGIGKTVSTLFPAIKAMAEGHVERIFYTTAKTSGRTVAEQTMTRLRSAGLKLRHVTLTARDKICFNDGMPCDTAACPFAIGYYDRIKAALREALREATFDRPMIERLARHHQVCPFELSLDLALWADLIICDYNYVFDPSVVLKRFFDEEKHRYAILIDEAHNLLDRAREMFSADLSCGEFLDLQQKIENDLPGCAKASGKVASRLNALARAEGWTEREGARIGKSVPDKLLMAAESFLEEAELWLAREEPAGYRESLLEIYFRTLAFARTAEIVNERFAAIYQMDERRLRLFCLDPSRLLRERIEKQGGAIFFSATLRPLAFFREALGGDPLDGLLQLGSPFPPENLKILVQDQIATDLKARVSSYDAVAESVVALVEARPGNYLVFFPSYAYLAEVHARFEKLRPDLAGLAQSKGMTEEARDEFIARLRTTPESSTVGFAVLGGVFGEGIDLVGDRLIGVIIVGVGLPQLCLERDLIKENCSRPDAQGFDFAYTFPGMNRVLQAVGRLIRTETDRGIVLLMDRRFALPPYRRLFPTWWAAQNVRSSAEIGAAARRFWAAPFLT